MFISYAQNFEDVMLWRALGHVENGFYIDIGAQDPIVDSVSLSFYENGWRGVHVEPTPAYAQALRNARPDETVVQAAVGDENALIPFVEIPGGGLSTGDANTAHRHEAAGVPTRRIDVPCIKLSALLENYQERDIHWMKIDVEGMELSVLRGWAPSQVRPWVIVLESTLPLSQELSHAAWEPIVLGLGYHFAYFDGLNRFYVSEQHTELLPAFSAPPNVFDDFAIAGTGTHAFCTKLNESVAHARHECAQSRLRQSELEYELRLAQQDDGARARATELERQVAEQAVREELSARDVLAQSQRIDVALQQLEQAKDETLHLLRRMSTKDDIHAAQLTAAHAESASLLRNLMEYEGLLGQARAQLELAQSDASRLQAELVQQREALATVVASVQRESQQREQATTNKALASCDAAMMQLAEAERRHTAALQTAHTTYSEHQQAMTRLTSTLEVQLRAETASARSDADAVRADAFALRAALERTHSSFSWQLTAPLRWVMSPVTAARGTPVARANGAMGMTTAFLVERNREGSTSTVHSIHPDTSLASANRMPKATDREPKLITAMNSHRQTPEAATDVQELLSLYDESFVRCAYVSILHRPVDPSGFAHYVGQVRQGAAKELIVAELAGSPEGRSLARDLPGLQEFLRRTRAGRSVLRRLLRRLGWIAQQSVAAQLRQIDNALYRMGEASAARFDRLEVDATLIKQLLQRQPAPASPVGATGQAAATNHRASLVAKRIVLTEQSPQDVIKGVARIIAESEEASLLSR